MRVRSILLSTALALGFTAAAWGQPTPPNSGEIHAEPEVQGVVTDLRGRAKPAHPRAGRAAQVALDRPTPDEISRGMSPPRKGAPLQIGFGRDVAATQDEAAFRGLLDWQPLPEGGSVAAITLTSPGASAIRAGLRIIALPPDAVLRFRAPGASEMLEVSGEDILDTIAQNLESGDHGPDARTYWGPAIEADSVTIEFELPADARPQDLRLSIPQLSHMVTSAKDDFVQKASSACQIDATCYTSTWGTEMNAVARMVFVVSGSTYLCTGTLIVDKDTSTTIPYFLSANHCINTQTVASTLQTNWFYRSPSCNAGTSSATTLSGGATLLYASSNTDTSFMRLNTTPPTGVTYMGWSVGSTVPLQSQMTGLHHPKGDPLKISFASLYSYAQCTPSSGGQFSCTESSSGTGTFYEIIWSSGLTEPGSSGSGLFLNNGHYLIGQLYGGTSECGVSSGPDFYGRFDVAYNASLSQWLGVTSSTRTLTVSKSGTGTGTVTSSPSGISCGSTCSASFSSSATVTLTATPSGTSVFSGWSGACSGTSTCSIPMSSDNSVTATFNDPALTPGAPQNLVGVAGNAQATFTFNPPSSTGGSAIVRYTVTCVPGNVAATGTSTTITVSGLTNNTTYTCSATATNATTTGPASNSVTVTPQTVPFAMTAAVSRSTQGGVVYDLPLDTTKPVTGAITIDPRVDNQHRVVFKFNATVTTGGVITVTDASGNPIGSASVATFGGEVIVILTGVDGRRIRVSAQGVNGVLDVATSVGFLVGDEDSSGFVDATDILRTKGRVGQAANASTYLYDTDLSGSVTASDLANVKAAAGAAIQ